MADEHRSQREGERSTPRPGIRDVALLSCSSFRGATKPRTRKLEIVARDCGFDASHRPGMTASLSAHALPGLAAADHAAERATLHTQSIRALQCDGRVVVLAGVRDRGCGRSTSSPRASCRSGYARCSSRQSRIDWYRTARRGHCPCCPRTAQTPIGVFAAGCRGNWPSGRGCGRDRSRNRRGLRRVIEAGAGAAEAVVVGAGPQALRARWPGSGPAARAAAVPEPARAARSLPEPAWCRRHCPWSRQGP